MKYEAPHVEVITIEAKEAVATHEEVDFGATISKPINP